MRVDPVRVGVCDGIWFSGRDLLVPTNQVVDNPGTNDESQFSYSVQ